MSTTYNVTVGDRGRLVVPAEIRERQHWEQGTSLVLIETDDGVLLTSKDRALDRVRKMLAGPSLAEELIAERRAEARREGSR